MCYCQQKWQRQGSKQRRRKVEASSDRARDKATVENKCHHSHHRHSQTPGYFGISWMHLADTMSAFCALALFTVISGAGSSTIVAPKQITGLVNGSITIRCNYSTFPIANKYGRKFWCKLMPHKRECYTVVSSTGFIHKEYMGRASISDSRENNYFNIEMSQLEMADAGYFRCGIGIANEGIFATVNVAVSDGD